MRKRTETARRKRVVKIKIIWPVSTARTLLLFSVALLSVTATEFPHSKQSTNVNCSHADWIHSVAVAVGFWRVVQWSGRKQCSLTLFAAMCCGATSTLSVSVSLVTAAVLVSLLLLCGDVESNPGPGPNHRNTSTVSPNQRTLPEMTSSSKTQNSAESPSLLDVMSILREIKTDIADVKADHRVFNDRLTDLEVENRRLRDQNDGLYQQMQNTETMLEDLQGRSRRNNLIFYNVPESGRDESGWDCEERVKDILTHEMGLKYDIPFDRVHRLNTKTSPRPIIACCTYFKDKQLILQHKKFFRKSCPVSVAEDFTPKVRDTRRKLQEKLHNKIQEAKSARRPVAMVHDHIYIDGTRYDYDATTDSVHQGVQRQTAPRVGLTAPSPHFMTTQEREGGTLVSPRPRQRSRSRSADSLFTQRHEDMPISPRRTRQQSQHTKADLHRRQERRSHPGGAWAEGADVDAGSVGLDSPPASPRVEDRLRARRYVRGDYGSDLVNDDDVGHGAGGVRRGGGRGRRGSGRGGGRRR